jgi:hypothetical protein
MPGNTANTRPRAFGTRRAYLCGWMAGRVIGNARDTDRGPMTSADSQETSHEED